MVKEKFRSSFFSALIYLLPDIKGGWLFNKLLFSIVPTRLREVTIEIFMSGKLILSVNLDMIDPPQYTMVRKKRYDLGTALATWFLLNEGDVFFDFGANNGFVSAFASEKVGDSGLVVSIEPNRQAFNALINRRLSNNFPLNYVGSDVAGKSYQLNKKFYRQTTSSYFTEGGNIKSISADYIYEKLNRSPVKVVKVDTEGAEFLVIKGAQKLLSESSPYLIVELEEEFLQRYGYDLVSFEKFMRSIDYNNFYIIDNEIASISSIDSLVDAEILFSKEELSEQFFDL